jgi:hypothetical protein
MLQRAHDSTSATSPDLSARGSGRGNPRPAALLSPNYEDTTRDSGERLAATS